MFCGFVVRVHHRDPQRMNPGDFGDPQVGQTLDILPLSSEEPRR